MATKQNFYELLQKLRDNNAELKLQLKEIDTQDGSFDLLTKISKDTYDELELVEKRLDDIRRMIENNQPLSEEEKNALLREADIQVVIPDITKLRDKYEEILVAAKNKSDDLEQKIKNFETDLTTVLTQQNKIVADIQRSVGGYKNKILELEIQLKATRQKAKEVDKGVIALTVIISSLLTLGLVQVAKWTKIFKPSPVASGSK